MSTEVEVIRYFEEQNKVVELYAKGYRESDIQKQLGLERRKIDDHLAEFRDYAKQDRVIRERAKEVVLIVDQHYNDLSKGMHENVEEADLAGDYKAALSGRKMIADVEAKRVELLAKAGILADSTIGDQIAEQEENTKILVGILQNIAKKYPDVAKEISFELSKVSGKVEPVRVVDQK